MIFISVSERSQVLVCVYAMIATNPVTMSNISLFAFFVSEFLNCYYSSDVLYSMTRSKLRWSEKNYKHATQQRNRANFMIIVNVIYCVHAVSPQPWPNSNFVHFFLFRIHCLKCVPNIIKMTASNNRGFDLFFRWMNPQMLSSIRTSHGCRMIRIENVDYWNEKEKFQQLFKNEWKNPNE